MNTKNIKKATDIHFGSHHRVLDLRKKNNLSSKDVEQKIKDPEVKKAIDFLDQLQLSSKTTIQNKITQINHSSLSEKEKQWLIKKIYQPDKTIRSQKTTPPQTNNTRQTFNKNVSPISLVPKIKTKAKPRRKLGRKKINYKFVLAVSVIIFLSISLIKLPSVIDHFHYLYQKISYSKKVIQKKLALVETSLKNKNLLAASQNLDQIQNRLEQIKKDTRFANSSLVSLISKLPIDSPVIQGQKLIKLGEDLTQFSNDLILTTESFNVCPIKNITDASSSPCLINSLSQSNLAIRLAQKRVDRLKNDFQELDLDAIPSSSRSLLKKLKNNLPQIKTTLNQLSQLSSAALVFLGEKTPRNYLVLFQNPAEIRGSGGFIGSYAQVKVFRGQIKEIKINDIYDPDGQLKEKFIPIKPLWRFRSNLQLTDTNWSADFPTSAQTFSHLFEDCGQPTPDGIIAINPFLIQDILKLIGPINLPNYQKIITAQNFFTEVQNEVEFGPDKSNGHPKKIIAQLTPILISKLSNFWTNSTWQQKAQLISLIWNHLDKKDILVYLPQEKDTQQIVSSFNWSGEIKPYLQDYLMVVNNNFLGSKSDWVIKQKINQEINIQKDGSIIKTVTITRQHQGNKYSEPFFQQKNQDYLTLLVPKGSQLISVSGFDFQAPINKPPSYSNLKSLSSITSFNQSFKRFKSLSNTDTFIENNLTGFGHWVIINPGQTRTFSFTYRLPFKINQRYTLLVQKQSGINSSLQTKIIWPKNRKLAWVKSFKNINIHQNEIDFSLNLTQDKTFGLVFK